MVFPYFTDAYIPVCRPERPWLCGNKVSFINTFLQLHLAVAF